MNKTLSPVFIELTQDALLKAIWYKWSLRLFLGQHKISESALAQWQADQSKRDFIQWLWPKLVNNEEGQNAILEMARSLAEMRHFPDLELAAAAAAMQQEMQRVKTMIRDPKTCQFTFFEAVRPRESTLRFGEVRTLLTTDTESLTKELFKRYVRMEARPHTEPQLIAA